MKVFLSLMITLVAASQVFAESYRTFVDSTGRNVVALTLIQSKIATEEVVANMRSEFGAAVEGSLESKLKITSANGKVILIIPESVSRSNWNHQVLGRFSDGDTRVLEGQIIINGETTNKLVEIFASE